jgi:glycosyltransferase involved in cell wall biosynthesis
MVSITRNRINFGPQKNLENCYYHARGDFVVEMCSDDALDKDFILECVKGFQKSPSSSFVMCHRGILNQKNELRYDEPPFYDGSYIIPNGLQASVYMMAAINPSVSQIMYKREKLINFNFPSEIISRWFGSRMKDFLLSLDSSIVYINKPLLLNRVHNSSESNQTTDTMLQIMGNYVLIYLFDEFALTSTSCAKNYLMK